MTDKQKQEIAKLRSAKYSYTRISTMLDIPVNTVKTYCRRHGLGGTVVEENVSTDGDTLKCLCCGVVIPQTSGRKAKKFCSDRCRNKWWNAHLDQVNRKANYEYVCPTCRKPFTAYGNSNRKYCSHECYIEDRFGGGSIGQ